MNIHSNISCNTKAGERLGALLNTDKYNNLTAAKAVRKLDRFQRRINEITNSNISEQRYICDLLLNDFNRGCKDIKLSRELKMLIKLVASYKIFSSIPPLTCELYQCKHGYSHKANCNCCIDEILSEK